MSRPAVPKANTGALRREGSSVIAPEHGAGRPVDAAALARIAARMDRAATPPWLHGEVARRMAERLPVIKLQPQRIVDWHAFGGASRALLAQAYPRAERVAVERRGSRRSTTAPTWWQRWRGAPSPVVIEDSLERGAAQLVWANMALHATPDPLAAMRHWHAALAVDGFLMFSTLGPGSLTGLGALYAAQGWPTPMAPFVDMHDLGDMLVEAGFADPVMDQETLTLTWPSPEALLDELRTLGGNAHPRRFAALRTPRWRKKLTDALGLLAAGDGRIALGFEIVYGHAFKPLPRPRIAAQTNVALDEMRALVRAGRPPTR